MGTHDPLAHQHRLLYQQVTPSDERSCLEQFLDAYRDEIAASVVALSDEAASARVLLASDLTVGGIVKHLAWSEDSWFQGKLLGLPCRSHGPPLHWWKILTGRSARRATTGISYLVTLYQDACDRSRSAAAQFESLSDLAARPSFGRGPVNLRWLLTHMIDETARHMGHITSPAAQLPSGRCDEEISVPHVTNSLSAVSPVVR